MVQQLARAKSVSAWKVISSQDAEIEPIVRQLAGIAQPGDQPHDRRDRARVPFSRLVALTPVANASLEHPGEPVYVVGKNLAQQGLDFFHSQPFPHRYAIASLEIGQDRRVHFLMKITWCRFLHSGWYDSGGRFVKRVEPVVRDEAFGNGLLAEDGQEEGTLEAETLGSDLRG